MIHICGRKVKVQTGTKSQTINICDARNIHGGYDYVIRLRHPFVSEDALRQRDFRSIEDLVRYLEREHFGNVERTPATGVLDPPRPAGLIPAPASTTAITVTKDLNCQPSSTWEMRAKLAVENSIDQFILEFIESPYLHRVEHSVHCELFRILTSRRIFSRTYQMGRWSTQPIHKEWPECLPRPDKGNRRGNFDLAVLSPDQLKACSFGDFREGRLRPCIAIEIGLDYPLRDHLCPDAAKLKNSGVPHSYLIHLVRQDFSDDFDAVDRFVLECDIKTAYARLTSSRAFYKLVNDDQVRSIEISASEFA
jgi:hypothetical protein